MDKLLEILEEKLQEMELLGLGQTELTLDDNQLSIVLSAVLSENERLKSKGEFTSKFAIGDPVFFLGHAGWIRAITFSKSKVRYFIFLDELKATIPDIDSALVDPGMGDPMEFEEDCLSL